MGFMKNMMEKSNEASEFLKEQKIDKIVNHSGNPYVVTSVILEEKLIGVGSKNLSELESVINKQTELGYELHTCSVSILNSKGPAGGDRLQATLIFKKIL